MNWLKMLLSVLAVLSLGGALAQSASADTIYTYTGNPFDQFSGGVACPSVCNISGSFTVAQPLSDLPVTSVIPLSFSFSDGATTITQLTNTFDSLLLPRNTFLLSTDSKGNIRAWFIIAELGAVGLETTSRIGGFIQGPPVDSGGRAAASAFVNDNPGTWSASTTATPEPATLLLFGSTIGVLAVIKRKKLARQFFKLEQNHLRRFADKGYPRVK